MNKMLEDSMNNRGCFSIEKVSDATAVVFANSYVNPISFLQYIEEQLASLNFSGEVVLDLLLSNGHASNRTIAGHMADGRIDRKAFKVVEFNSLDAAVLEKIKAFYKSNGALVQSNFILSDEEKETLLR
jgi:Antitoxin to bacterial toxin RNase LS or RnlA